MVVWFFVCGCGGVKNYMRGGLPLIHFGDNASLFCFFLGAVMRDEGE